MEIKYSCQTMPARFTTINGNRFIKPTKDGVIYWYIRNYSSDMTQSDILVTIQNAFDVWAKEMYPIKFELTSEEKKAEIRITFSTNSQLDADPAFKSLDPFLPPFPFEDGVLAYAFPPADHAFSSDLWMNDDIKWYNVVAGKKDRHEVSVAHMQTVLIHEIGHTLNIGHSADRKSIMYPTYNGPIVILGDDDKIAIQHLYGSIIAKLKATLNLYTSLAEEEYSLPSEDEMAMYSKYTKNDLVLEIHTRNKVINKLQNENFSLKTILERLKEFWGDIQRQQENLDFILDTILAGRVRIILNLGKLVRAAKEVWTEFKTKSANKLNDILLGK